MNGIEAQPLLCRPSGPAVFALRPKQLLNTNTERAVRLRAVQWIRCRAERRWPVVTQGPHRAVRTSRHRGETTAAIGLLTIVLLVPDNKTEDDYILWSAQVGKPSDLGVQLMVAISYSDRPGPHVVATGIVGVPRPPEDDLERQILATKIANLIESPDIAVFEFTGLLRWRLVKGGPFEIELTESRQVRELDKSEVSNRISLSGPGPMNEPVFRTKFPESNDWKRKYRANRYLRFESRAGLSQRYQDLLTNITILTNDGRVDLTQEKHWHRLFRHVVDEMLIRGEPPVPHNFEPSIAPAILFPDKELCTRAADALARVPTEGRYLVKYGQADHMTRLYDDGEVYLTPASAYGDPDHNQAIYDQELSSSHYAVVATDGAFLKARDVYANPDVLQATGHRVVPMFLAPDAARDEVGCIESYGPDAWMYCMSDLVTPRLFSDFNADACVVLCRDQFDARICDALRPHAGKKVFAHGHVRYVDPFGAYAEQPRPPNVHIGYGASTNRDAQPFQPFGPDGELARPPEVHFSKTFRFAYQSEYRFVSYPPQPIERLDAPLTISLGALHDIGQLIVL